MTVIDQIGDYKILKSSRGYIVKNKRGSYRNHGHFKQLKTYYSIMQRHQVPKSRYLRGSVLRISVDDRYRDKVQRKIDKDKNKGYYFNPQKGVKE